MTTEQWLAASLAAAPPLTPGQLAALRPVCQRMAAHMKAASVTATTEAAVSAPHNQNESEELDGQR